MKEIILDKEDYILRPVNINDASDFFRFGKDPIAGLLKAFIPHLTIESSIRELEEYIEYNNNNDFGYMSLYEKKIKTVVGIIFLKKTEENILELGFIFNKGSFTTHLMGRAINDYILKVRREFKIREVEGYHIHGDDLLEDFFKNIGFSRRERFVGNPLNDGKIKYERVKYGKMLN